MHGSCDVVKVLINEYGVDPASRAKASALVYGYIVCCDLGILDSQNGLQPIHHAAQEGHEEIVRMLVNDFHVKPDVTSNVSHPKI